MFVGYLLLFALISGLVVLVVINQPKKKKSYGGGSATKISLSEVRDKWENIENTFSLGGPSHFKAAIMDADKLVDSVMAAVGVSGKTMGERLKNAKSRFKNYEDYNNLWFAHKVRNNIAHEIGHELNSAEAKRAMEYFKKALKEFGAIK